MNAKRHIQLDGCLYSAPAQAPDDEGDTVLIRAASIAPLECWEGGFDREGRPSESYRRLENDFYEDENVRRTISRGELLEQLERLIQRLRDIREDEWTEEYSRLCRQLRYPQETGRD